MVRYDNAVTVFYKLIATGLCSTQPDNVNMRAVLEDAAISASPVEHTVSLISEMRTDRVKRALVPDDMHLITNGEMVKSLPYVLKRLPLTFVTQILSRAPLPEGFCSLIKSERGIITAEHLRFTQNEIHEYFKSLGLFLTPEESGAAQIVTDGRAIGVNAVAQSGDQSEQIILLGLAGVSYERNELKLALDVMDYLNNRMTEQNSIELRVSAKFLYHDILLQMGQNRETATALSELDAFVKNSARFFLANLEAYMVKLKLFDCDRAAARAWMDNYYVVDAGRIELYLLFQHFTTARAHIALGGRKERPPVSDGAEGVWVESEQGL